MAGTGGDPGNEVVFRGSSEHSWYGQSEADVSLIFRVLSEIEELNMKNTKN